MKSKTGKRFDIFTVQENGKTLTVKSYNKQTTLNSIGIRIKSGCVYYYHGKIHRELGPAIVGIGSIDGIPYLSDSFDGNIKIWVKNGKIHNDFGPAYKSNNTKKWDITKWYINGKLHRTNGPALIIKAGYTGAKIDQEYYYINGIQLPTEEAKINTERLNTLNSILNSPFESPFEMLKIRNDVDNKWEYKN